MGVKNDILWSETGPGFGEPGSSPPTNNSQEYPPGFKTTNLPCVNRVAFFDDKQRNVPSGVPLLSGSLH